MSDSDFNRRLRETFQAEAAEHLQALSQGAFALEQAAPVEQRAIIEKIFRETHTLKGAARMVGEEEIEAICHGLEQQLSEVKQESRPLLPPAIAELHREIALLARLLRQQTPAPAMPPKSEAQPAATPEIAAPTTAQVRVSTARLDSLLMHAEEMIGAKLTGEQRIAALRQLSDRASGWKKEWARVRAEVAALRRFVDSGEPSPVERELRAVVHYLDTQHEFIRGWQTELARLTAAGAGDQRRLGAMVGQLLDETKEILMQPFSALLEMFPAFVREIARQQGKEIDFEVRGASTEMDRRVLEEIKDALVHLVRNAIDHGIEAPAERRASGKPERGRIELAVRERSGGDVEIAVSDNGRGIDPEQVAASARRLGLIGEDVSELSHNDVLALLFSSGFSTRANATALSGRGLGLAIVREKAERIGGGVSVESRVGQGTTFRLTLPITLARFRGLFVEANRHRFVIASSHVQRVLRVRESQLRRVKNQTLIETEGGAVVVWTLAELLGVGAAAKERGRHDPTSFLLLVEAGRSRLGLRVDGAPVEEEIVMKSLGKMLRGARHYIGATIVAGGEIVPVLNITDLLAAAVRRGASRKGAAPAAAKAPERKKRRILVAEDSITSRSLLKNILQTAGFEVLTAVDGADALTTLKFEPVDLLISDVQMPRLDGFELTAKVRADSALSTLPVILITSLASREDKARGVGAGANAYIVKSSFDQSDLLEAIGRLIP